LLIYPICLLYVHMYVVYAGRTLSAVVVRSLLTHSVRIVFGLIELPLNVRHLKQVGNIFETL